MSFWIGTDILDLSYQPILPKWTSYYKKSDFQVYPKTIACTVTVLLYIHVTSFKGDKEQEDLNLYEISTENTFEMNWMEADQ